MDWKKAAKDKRDSVLALIQGWQITLPMDAPKDITGSYIQQYLSAKAVEITETDTLQILEKVGKGEWSAREVVEAFCHRAAVAHQLVPCLTEIMFSAALEHASELDAYFATHGKPSGPLHGLPVSLKDQVNVEGVDSATGVVSYIGNGAQNKDSEIVRSLRALGAVPFVKTTVPQFSFSLETENNIYGYTFNPFNNALTAGGSSGGEGALLGLKGSPLGFGTDIGGSIRVPAAFNGLFGLKPSTQRLPFAGIKRVGDGQAGGTPFVIGPLANSAEALAFSTKTLLSVEPWLKDPEVVNLPWREEMYRGTLQAAKGDGKKMKFGVLRDDGVVRPQPPVQRALEMTVNALQKLGHEIVEWKPPSHETAIGLAYKTWQFDGGSEVHAALKATGEPRSMPRLGPGPECTATTIMETNIAVRDFRQKYLNYWNETEVDAVISPVSPYAAPEIRKFKYIKYTPWVNLLDYSAAVIPVTKADEKLDVYATKDYSALGEEDKTCHEDYDPAIFHGAPVGLQIVCRRLEEEKACALAEVLGDAVKAEGQSSSSSMASHPSL